MKTINVVAAVIIDGGKVFATQRGYGEWKDWWEFPGGKMEQGEHAPDALRREIREELTAEIEVGRLIATVEHDYTEFHLSMQCYLCRVAAGSLRLLEHESAQWVGKHTLHSLRWLPADRKVLPEVQKLLE